jgi:hypothetical protein
MLERNLKRVQEFPSPEKDIFHKWRLGFWAVMDGLINACQIYLANAEWLNLGPILDLATESNLAGSSISFPLVEDATPDMAVLSSLATTPLGQERLEDHSR